MDSDGVECFSDNFILSSTGEDEFWGIVADNKHSNQEKPNVLDLKPFNSHWSTEKPIRNFSFPKKMDANSDYLIDFWSNFETGELLSLPTLGYGKSDSIKRISSDVVTYLLESDRKYLIIDCRYGYEYSGGHIRNAININDKDNINILFRKYEGYILVFYCEFSSVRAPRLANEVRNVDRRLSEYPKLIFPEIYIMDGGYSNFFKKYKTYCSPQQYIPMIKRPKSFIKKP
ncbi:M-phase inducer phosphatase 3 [Dictyocoela muelleri]|nr:M-phase inducer phosphatase 3 [Dictyocoela muelleri]